MQCISFFNLLTPFSNFCDIWFNKKIMMFANDLKFARGFFLFLFNFEGVKDNNESDQSTLPSETNPISIRIFNDLASLINP